MKNLPQAVTNYLEKRASAKWKVELKQNDKFENIIVVPAIDEYDNIIRLLKSLSECESKYFEKSLVLFVINNTQIHSLQVKENNRKTIEFLKSIIDFRKNEKKKFKLKNIFSIGIVDASSESLELPDKDGGVGLARKIGMDLALEIFDYSSSRKKILICLDADCIVEKNYLTAIVEEINKKNISAAYINYEHILPDNENERAAIICYEIFLRYYECGLKYAKSPFAFPTIGSTICCDYESYIKAGGMNKRKAAEDFYFMEKLAKICTIEEIKNTTVFPSGRTSWRVPFGTGQRVNRFLEGKMNEYTLFNPFTFKILKKWDSLFLSDKMLKTEDYLSEAEKIEPLLKDFLIMNSFMNQWNKIVESSKTKKQLEKQKIIWFDGFKTLKLIHFLRDKSYPPINMFDALDIFFEMINVKCNYKRTSIIPGLENQLEYLKLLKSASIS